MNTVFNLNELSQLYKDSTKVVQIFQAIKQQPHVKVHLSGLFASSLSFYLSGLYKSGVSKMFFLLPDEEEANFFYDELTALLGNGKVQHLKSGFEIKRASARPKVKDRILERTLLMDKLYRKNFEKFLIVAHPEALLEKVSSASQMNDKSIQLKVGEPLDMDFFIDFLVELGYFRTEFVTEPGTFSLRGEIIDVFSFAHQYPLRIRLAFDEIEAIFAFEQDSQLSKTKMNFVSIMPNPEEEQEEEGAQVEFLSLLPEDTLMVFKNLDFCIEATKSARERLLKLTKEDVFDEELLYNPNQFNDIDQVKENLLQFRALDYSVNTNLPVAETITFDTKAQEPIHKNFQHFANLLADNEAQGLQNFIFSSSKKQIERIYAIIEDHEKEMDRAVNFTPIYHHLYRGFVDKEQKLACFAEHQLFDRYTRSGYAKKHDKSSRLSLKELIQMQPGDYVTHIDHGVGIYSGLEKMEVNGKMQEAVRIRYKGGDLLYVNIHSLDKIARYSGADADKVKLHKLGGAAWNKLKNRTKGKVKDIARDLIKLYAKRKTQEGFAFSPDSSLQTALEASFIYEDTPDQAKSTEEVKADMEKDTPMDRLVCGDVGFGKTEVAIRAAFKAVYDQKQVAVLVPTTVLALQHYHTFKKRLKDFPVKVDYISRLRSAKEMTDIRQKLAEGKIDILIGTHRILGKQLKFKDLGLLIIDEEQKFGVAAKEKLRALKANIDTLTLTATPIPRTLQFSLLGARDLSVINTPPPNRQVTETKLISFDKEVLQEILEFELERGGQVFFVHNRISDIFKLKDTLLRLVPKAKIGVGHGQMPPKELEEVMYNFVEGFYDILVSTSIVESGLDIPNANTIIIDNAQNFGLSDLYQMRGRVGRSNKKAYCYLITPSLISLNGDARKRLRAIEELTELGSGFQIAMRDLDIRGAGNLLGGEQSGFITEMGYEMFQKVLDEALQELKSEEFEDIFEAGGGPKRPKRVINCQLDTDLELLLPDAYVGSVQERMSLYHRLNALKKQEELDAFTNHLEDRFGKLPRQAIDLLKSVELKWKAGSMKVEKLSLKNSKMKLYFVRAVDDQEFYESELFGKILRKVQKNPAKFQLKQDRERLTLWVKKINSPQNALKCLQELEA